MKHSSQINHNERQLHATSLFAGYQKRNILENIDISIPEGKICVILGANACGKSTLLKTFSRLLKPSSGDVAIGASPILKIPTKQLARTLGLLPQSPVIPEGIAVADLVARGRYPHQSLLKGLTAIDYEAIDGALQIMGISDLSDRCVDELSGGQRQRVWIAMALAQQTDILLLDEPTTFLDISYQIEILDLLTDLNRKRGTTIVMVLHDINLSARYADHIFALHQGRLVAQGCPKEVINESIIKTIYNLECKVILDPVSHTPFIIPMGRYHIRLSKSLQTSQSASSS